MNILTLNVGSTSVKMAVFRAGPDAVTPQWRDRRDSADATFPDFGPLDAVGHRVVHGGPDLVEPARVTDAVLAELKRVTPFDPLHMRPQVGVIEWAVSHFAGLPQVVCFDTAFHAGRPPIDAAVPLPKRLLGDETRRYGFHGLSYESIAAQLGGAAGRVVVAHLGGGSSLAGLIDGRCVSTTMGFTPAAGLVMGTRPGDLDPALVTHLMRTHGLGPDDMDAVLYGESGLTALAGTGDVAELTGRTDADAAFALELFCRRVAQAIAATAVDLGGLDALVFTGGIGQNSPAVREGVCGRLALLGVGLDAARNAAGESVVSFPESRVTVRVMATDEESVVARHTARVLETESRQP